MVRERDIESRYLNIVSQLESMAGGEEIKGRNWAIFNYALDAVSAFGINIPRLRQLAKETGRDHALAQRLWSDNGRETRILATMIDEPGKVTEEQMEKWASNFFYWEICDQCCRNLFSRTKYAHRKSLDWSAREEEYVKRAAFVLMASLATDRGKADESMLEGFLPILEREATDNRRFVKTSVRQALREIGRRSPSLQKKAMKVARRLGNSSHRSARWIGQKVIGELGE